MQGFWTALCPKISFNYHMPGQHSGDLHCAFRVLGRPQTWTPQGKLGWWDLPWPKLLVVCLIDQPSQSLMPVRFRSWWKYMQAP